MRAHQILKEYEIRFAEFGYWITPDGDVIPCSDNTPEEPAARQIGEEPAENPQGRQEQLNRAMEQGGVIILAPSDTDEFAAEWSASISQKARDSMLRILSLYSGRGYFMIQKEPFDDFQRAVKHARNA
jgi:hypothetical protein